MSDSNGAEFDLNQVTGRHLRHFSASELELLDRVSRLDSIVLGDHSCEERGGKCWEYSWDTGDIAEDERTLPAGWWVLPATLVGAVIWWVVLRGLF